jgi:hypothetical protein
MYPIWLPAHCFSDVIFGRELNILHGHPACCYAHRSKSFATKSAFIVFYDVLHDLQYNTCNPTRQMDMHHSSSSYIPVSFAFYLCSFSQTIGRRFIAVLPIPPSFHRLNIGSTSLCYCFWSCISPPHLLVRCGHSSFVVIQSCSTLHLPLLPGLYSAPFRSQASLAPTFPH